MSDDTLLQSRGVRKRMRCDGATADTIVLDDGDRRVTLDAADGGVRVEVSEDGDQ